MLLRAVFVLGLFCAPVMAAEYSPFVNQDIPLNVYWGDTHVHTSYSPDASMLGNTRLGPEQAYRFARGEKVLASNGMQAKLVRPLDFLVVADHAEYMGLMPRLRNADPELLKHATGKRWYDWFQEGREGQLRTFQEFSEDLAKNKSRIPFDAIARSTWDFMAQTADRFNQPGRFTALIGYEWSSTPAGNNLHRVVVFRDGADKVTQFAPFSSFDSVDPEDLWAHLAAYEADTNGRVMAIPHNANLSNGLMYDTQRLNGQSLTQEYARTRMRFERLLEVTQIKGDSETHPLLSPDDEFADFERMDKSNLLGTAAMQSEMFPGSYARSALKRGFELAFELGENPFKLGFIGSTDSHNSLATANERNFFGKAAVAEPRPDRWQQMLIPFSANPTTMAETSASGLAAVWARDNTREEIFAALERREAYATTGSRIVVRLFGGWDFEADDVQRSDYAAHGYAHGVPMGGDLVRAPEHSSPRFMVRTMRDPNGANLARVQMVKGWLDADGSTYERIYDLAAMDESPLFYGFWVDPDFDEAEHAFYYVRVLEAPTPRWTARDAEFFSVDLPKRIPKTLQERAYTSPIWYSPHLASESKF